MEKEIKHYSFQILSSDILKIFAVITMLIDHVGAGIIEYQYLSGQYPFGMDAGAVLNMYNIFRQIGRQAFPIYCFLLIEGFMYTRSRKNYLRNLLIFAFISELPFDFALIGNDITDFDFIFNLKWYWPDFIKSQNVYFTLAIGFIVIWISDLFWKKVVPGYDVSKFFKDRLTAIIVTVSVTIAGCLLANALRTDYKYWGIIIIVIFYIFRAMFPISQIAGYLTLSNLYLEEYSLLAFVLTALYNGKRSETIKKFKYFFYFFYPVHLALIFIIRCILY
ncbi:MAG: conjugal transfer protein TraX [Butyrivibrio sp.]|nr:conjugal transfer protein TraX [Butyrivibrio sp.]